MRPVSLRLALLVAGLVSLPAFAASTVTAQLSNIRFSIVDHAPDDGISSVAPDFAAQSIFGVTSVYDRASGQSDYRRVDATGGAHSDNMTFGGYQASWSQTPGIDGALSAASAASGYGSSSTIVDWMAPFDLAPHSTVTMTVHVKIDWLSDGTEPLQEGWASAGLGVVSTGPGGDWGRDIADVRLRGPGSLEQDVTVTFTNNRDFTLNFFASADTSTFLAATAPIPEPSTYAMLTAGLVLTGVAARRRKQAGR